MRQSLILGRWKNSMKAYLTGKLPGEAKYRRDVRNRNDDGDSERHSMRNPHNGMERRAAICNKKSGYRTRLTGKSIKRGISPVFPGRLHCTCRYDSVCTFRSSVTYIFVFYGIYRPSYRTGIFLLFLRDRDYRLPDFIVLAPTGSIAGTFVLCRCHCPDAV